MDRRQLLIRVAMLLVVAVAIYAGWRASQNAAPMAEMKAAREAAREAAEAEQKGER